MLNMFRPTNRIWLRRAVLLEIKEIVVEVDTSNFLVIEHVIHNPQNITGSFTLSKLTTVDSEFREEVDDINSDVDKTESYQEVDLSTFNEDLKFSFGTRIELLYCGKATSSDLITNRNCIIKSRF